MVLLFHAMFINDFINDLAHLLPKVTSSQGVGYTLFMAIRWPITITWAITTNTDRWNFVLSGIATSAVVAN